MSAWTEDERKAVHGHIHSHAHWCMDKVEAWLDGGPVPFDRLGTIGCGLSGPWPMIAVKLHRKGIEVYRRGPAEDAAGRAWVEYWIATIGHHGSAGSTQAQRDAAPPVPHEERDGEWHLIAWADVHALLVEHVHGDAQPALFDLPVAA